MGENDGGYHRPLPTPSEPMRASQGRSEQDDLYDRLLPLPLEGRIVSQWEKPLRRRIETILAGLCQKLLEGSLTHEQAVCGLGHIAGYREVLQELERDARAFMQERSALMQQMRE